MWADMTVIYKLFPIEQRGTIRMLGGAYRSCVDAAMTQR